ncbi:hypothetical protein [Candidatus Uabimicrobium amorphum]|uniref:Uncharacterized protein n=1 Tax=Uabimicrobium amorphum TaxID=2596890 RepID=A0A5S9IKD3_UABAM|nr:hypothetical protein [Candidatus Uabimicrobium amorphum]BBM83479.1 hypothetical protein UABAM_01831 [Candidatus Uabimicrobium amorphum]
MNIKHYTPQQQMHVSGKTHVVGLQAVFLLVAYTCVACLFLSTITPPHFLYWIATCVYLGIHALVFRSTTSIHLMGLIVMAFWFWYFPIVGLSGSQHQAISTVGLIVGPSIAAYIADKFAWQPYVCDAQINAQQITLIIQQTRKKIQSHVIEVSNLNGFTVTEKSHRLLWTIDFHLQDTTISTQWKIKTICNRDQLLEFAKNLAGICGCEQLAIKHNTHKTMVVNFYRQQDYIENVGTKAVQSLNEIVCEELNPQLHEFANNQLHYQPQKQLTIAYRYPWQNMAPTFIATLLVSAIIGPVIFLLFPILLDYFQRPVLAVVIMGGALYILWQWLISKRFTKTIWNFDFARKKLYLECANHKQTFDTSKIRTVRVQHLDRLLLQRRSNKYYSKAEVVIEGITPQPVVIAQTPHVITKIPNLTKSEEVYKNSERLYNHALSLANTLAKSLSIPVDYREVKDIQEQHCFADIMKMLYKEKITTWNMHLKIWQVISYGLKGVLYAMILAMVGAVAMVFFFV